MRELGAIFRASEDALAYVSIGSLRLRPGLDPVRLAAVANRCKQRDEYILEGVYDQIIRHMEDFKKHQ